MRLILSLTAASVALAGCAVPVVAPAPPPVIVAPMPAPGGLSSAQRAAATTVVNREMATRLPGVNVAPYTACVINNATMAELADLAGMTGNSAAAATAVASIVKRPAATQCIAAVSRTV